MIETEGLTHIQLIVADVQRSLAFYSAVFGMQVRFWEGETMVFIATPGRRDSITLNQSGEPGRAGASGGVDHFGFRLVNRNDIDRAIDTVEAAGGRLIERGEHAPGHPYAYVSDPDGYVIEL